MERRNASQYINVKEVDRENYRVYFTFSSDAVDRHGEVIDQAGWRLENYLKNPVVLWGHDQRQFPIGKAEDLAVRDGKLGGWVRFAYKENPDAAVVFELVAGGYLNAGSVGFMNMKWMYDEDNDLLTLLENELYEFSIVNVPANPDALAKAYTDLKEKGIDKKVIGRVKELRDARQKALDDRFKDLGEEVKDADDAEEETETPDDAPIEEETKAITTEDLPENQDGDDEEVTKAMETILKAGPTKIQEAVASLTDNLKDADNKGKVENTPEKPQGRAVRKYSTHEINRVIRSLMKASK